MRRKRKFRGAGAALPGLARLACLIWLIVASTPLLAREAGNKDLVLVQDLDPRLARIIDSYRASIPGMMVDQELPGLVIALVFDGELIWAEGFGSTDRQSDQPVTVDTMFSIQSISKTYTATMVMAAVDAGLVTLNEPITTYLPGLFFLSGGEALDFRGSVPTFRNIRLTRR